MDLTLAAEAPPRPRASAARAASSVSPARELIAPALLLVAALFIYRPWAAAPFSTLDFSEFLPLLRQGDGFFGRFVALAHYFAGHGRSAWVTYAWISLNWSLFGDWSTGWDLMRFALMSGVVALAFAFLRRLGCSRVGAAAGAALLVVATPAQEGWTRLTGEPLGLAALLGAALLALGYRAARRWPVRAVAIALLLGLAVLAKEVLAVGALPVLVLAACWRPGRGLRRPSLSKRTWVLAALSVLAVGAAAALVLSTLAATPANGYAQSYGNGAMNSVRLKLNLQLLMMPISRTLPANAQVAAALAGIVAVAGWGLLLRKPHLRASRAAGLLLALLVPVMGAVVYLPWPRMERFYGLPFLAGAAVLLGMGLTSLERRIPPVAALLPVLAALALSAADAAAHSGEAMAVRRMNGVLARALGTMPRTDTVFMALPGVEHAAQAWQGPGPTLRRYALATGVAGPGAPVVADATCQDVQARWSQAPLSITFISYAHMCGPIPGPAVVVEQKYGYVDLIAMQRRPMAARADLWLPGALSPAPGTPAAQAR